MLLLILQRYYFESESQLVNAEKELERSCCLSYKDTILKANHSTFSFILFNWLAVAYPTKILFWKRITAISVCTRLISLLLLILQRYYFESESQREELQELSGYSCCLSYKDTILKANHSGNLTKNYYLKAVAYPTKILFWKRITAPCLHSRSSLPLLLILQRYYFESESQRTFCLFITKSSCCLSYKDTILKANHSTCDRQIGFPWAVAYPTKILFWKRITAHSHEY